IRRGCNSRLCFAVLIFQAIIACWNWHSTYDKSVAESSKGQSLHLSGLELFSFMKFYITLYSVTFLKSSIILRIFYFYVKSKSFIGTVLHARHTVIMEQKAF